MKPQCEIKFTTTRSDTDLNAGIKVSFVITSC